MALAATQMFVFQLLVLSSVFFICRCDDARNCSYTVYVQTGSMIKAGTDSTITLSFSDASGKGFRINNLEQWGGLMGPGYDYFEKGNLDIFSGRGQCLPGPVCSMTLTSDGKGLLHGWYVNYVEVTSTGINQPCAQQYFQVEQWLTAYTWPSQLTAIRNNCKPSLSSSSSDEDKESVIDSPLLSII